MSASSEKVSGGKRTAAVRGGLRGDLRFVSGVLVAIALAQATLVAITLPIQTFTNGDWFAWQVDHPYHWYQIFIARDLWADGSVVGYDPRFAAGYLGGVPFNPSAKFPALIHIVLSSVLSQEQAYKLYLAAASLVAVMSVPLAARCLGCSRSVLVWASVLGLLFWWVSAARWFYTVGMVSFVLSCYLALAFFARSRLLLSGPVAPLAGVALGLCGALGFLLHPLFPVLVLLLLLPDAAFRLKDYLSWSAVANAAVVATISLLPNLLWLIPTLSLPVLNDGTDSYQKAVDAMKIVQEAAGLWTGNAMGSKLNPLFLLLSGIGLYRERTRAGSTAAPLLSGLMIAWGGAVVFGCLGAVVPAFARLYPNRFAPLAYIFLIIPAAYGILALGYSLSRVGNRKKIAAAITLMPCAALGIVVLHEFRREVSSAPVGHYGKLPPETRPLGEMSQWIIDSLGRHTNNSGRVLFETSLGRVHDGGHMAGFYAIRSSREFVGGPYPFAFFAGFWDGWVFGKPIADHPADRFILYLDLYNVRWIVAHSKAAKTYLQKVSSLELVDSQFGIAIFRRNAASTFFIEGSGRVDSSATNRLILSDLSPGEVTIKYHYFPGLVADPPIPIEAAFLDLDPQPFIRIRNGEVRNVKLSWAKPSR
jgi:hypothetical protein